MELVKLCPYNGVDCSRELCMAWKEIYDWDEDEYRETDHGYCKLIPNED